jgi:translation initiation factor IF-3
MQATNNNQAQYKLRKNQQIRIPQVRLILSDGSNGGIMATYEALKLAQDEGLDLVEINPRGVPPVAKICNYGKLLYDEKKKAQENKKAQRGQELKELVFRPATDTHDMLHKLEQAKGFLLEGCKIRFVVKFRGREITHPDIGKEKLEFVIKELQGLIVEKPQITLEGKLMSMTVQPSKQKVNQ